MTAHWAGVQKRTKLPPSFAFSLKLTGEILQVNNLGLSKEGMI